MTKDFQNIPEKDLKKLKEAKARITNTKKEDDRQTMTTPSEPRRTFNPTPCTPSANYGGQYVQPYRTNREKESERKMLWVIVIAFLVIGIILLAVGISYVSSSLWWIVAIVFGVIKILIAVLNFVNQIFEHGFYIKEWFTEE